MSATDRLVIYWDTSAIVSALFDDVHSSAAASFRTASATHILSSLAWAETHAVIARLERTGTAAAAAVGIARHALERGPWRYASIDPDRRLVARLSTVRALRGPDLWHLAAAKHLQVELPELTLLSYDEALNEAARLEGLPAPG